MRRGHRGYHSSSYCVYSLTDSVRLQGTSLVPSATRTSGGQAVTFRTATRS